MTLMSPSSASSCTPAPSSPWHHQDTHTGISAVVFSFVYNGSRVVCLHAAAGHSERNGIRANAPSLHERRTADYEERIFKLEIDRYQGRALVSFMKSQKMHHSIALRRLLDDVRERIVGHELSEQERGVPGTSGWKQPRTSSSLHMAFRDAPCASHATGAAHNGGLAVGQRMRVIRYQC